MSAQARARFFSGSMLLPAAMNTRTWPGLRSFIKLLWEIRSSTQHCDAYVFRSPDRARLVDGQAHPLHAELFEDEQRGAMREGLHQLEVGFADEGDQALGDLLVIECLGDIVELRGARAIHRHLDIEHDDLLDA